MRQPSLTLRLTLFFIVASSSVLVSIGVWVGESVKSHFREQDYTELTGKLELVRSALSDVHAAPDLTNFVHRLNDALIGHSDLSISIWSGIERTLVFEAGKAIFAAPVLPTDPPVPIDWQQGDHGYRGITTSIRSNIREAPDYTVAIALNIGHHQAFLSTFGRTLWAAILFGIGLTGILGWIAARRGLSPLRQISTVAQKTTASHLDERLPINSVPVELIGIATSFNDMIARLEDSFQRLSAFSSDIAHELRTPISNLMTQTQVALTKARSAEEYREILYSNQEEYDRLSRMIADMLYLAKADNGLIMPTHEPVNLANCVDLLFEFYEAFAAEQHIQLVRIGNAVLVGDTLMLRRALGNLLSNALHHTAHGGTVMITLSESDSDGIKITIENPGPNIAPEHLPRLFDRFYRVDPARQTNKDGVGLGLAITQSIVRAHGGEITALSEHGVTRFTLAFRD